MPTQERQMSWLELTFSGLIRFQDGWSPRAFEVQEVHDAIQGRPELPQVEVRSNLLSLFSDLGTKTNSSTNKFQIRSQMKREINQWNEWTR